MPKINIALFVDMQEKLDQSINKVRSFNGNLIDEKVLALQVELGELAQEWGLFKFWKEKPVTKSRENMLEEYVDVFHFILSLIVERLEVYPSLRNLVIEYPEEQTSNNPKSVVKLFNALFENTSYMIDSYPFNYKALLRIFFKLGFALGFDFDEVTHAYIRKNAKNHERLQNGY